jgi:hypothetical protein
LKLKGEAVVELGHEVETPQRNPRWEKRGEVGVRRIEFVRGEIEPMTGYRMPRSHGETFDSLDGGV